MLVTTKSTRSGRIGDRQDRGAIVPRVAPPPGWPSVRLTVGNTGGRRWIGQDRDGKALGRCTRRKHERARGRRVILTGDRRAVRRGVVRPRRPRSGFRTAATSIDGRSRPSRRPCNSAVEKATLTACAETALENAEVSPVLSLVAVTVTQVPTARPLDRLKLIVAMPLASVVTVVEPRNVWPWPKPDGSGTRLLKNWIRNAGARDAGERALDVAARATARRTR